MVEVGMDRRAFPLSLFWPHMIVQVLLKTTETQIYPPCSCSGPT